MKRMSLDTETTGLDLYHGCRPFLVTVCFEDNSQYHWRWPVDPLTRKVYPDQEELKEIEGLVHGADELILQNAKFDVQGLKLLIPHLEWPWHKTRDTLYADHLLYSALPHNLTELAFRYLRVNIKPLEDALKKATQEARRLARSKFKDWRIAKDGCEELPSVASSSGDAKGNASWRYDTWLPRVIAEALEYPPEHPWHCVLEDYADRDSETTLAVWLCQRQEITGRDLWAWFDDRMKVPPINVEMETRGVSGSRRRGRSLRKEYEARRAEIVQELLGLAGNYDYDLEIPKGARNDSIRTFAFDVLKLPVVARTDTGQPSLDKDALEVYQEVLTPGSDQYRFVTCLQAKTKRDTAIGYMDSYDSFFLPVGNSKNVATLHPSFNPTGTKTPRWSCANPNTQQISKKGIEILCPRCRGNPRGCDYCKARNKGGDPGYVVENLRWMFGPAPDREWWSMDGKNLELRIPAYKAGEKDMIGLFERPKDPPYYGSNHLLNFSAVYPELWEEHLQTQMKDPDHIKKTFKDTHYQWCKNGGFAKQYGGQRAKVDATFRRAGAFDLMETRFAGLAELNKSLLAFSGKHGYVETIPDRRVGCDRGYPLMVERNEWKKAKPTLPLSYYVQGTACTWMQGAMIRCAGQLKDWYTESEGRWDGFICMNVHDELVFDLPRRMHPKTDPKRSNLGKMRVLQRLMEMGGEDIGVPTPCSLEYHDENWSEGVTL